MSATNPDNCDTCDAPLFTDHVFPSTYYLVVCSDCMELICRYREYLHWDKKRANAMGYATIFVPKINAEWYVAIDRVKLERGQAKIVSPGQACIGCSLPAPHAIANCDEGFLCRSCNMMRQL